MSNCDLYDLLDHIQKLHFVGIGGSGMSPIAEILHNKGFTVTGSDTNESENLNRVRSCGIPVTMGHKAENIGDAEAVVYTAAVKQDNPELLAASEKNIPIIERAVMLGLLTRRYENAIAVAGTHGKTTTTAMITQVLITGGKDPSAVIGGRLPLLHSNARIGHSQTMVCEACEYVDTFLHLHPSLSVILNIDGDHLEYFGTIENIIASFHKFAGLTSKTLVVNGDDENSMAAIEGITGKTILTFGMGDNNDYYAENVRQNDHYGYTYTLMYQGKALTEIVLTVPGKHNLMNSLAAASACHFCGVAPEKIAEGLHAFTGVHRRFEILGKFNGVTVADDFAHHPTELRATLSAAMQMGFSKVWAVFQPHTYSRTALLMDDFAEALSIPDRVILTEILAVRETNTYNVYSRDLAAKVPNAIVLDSFEKITDYVVEHAQPGDLIITLGGGNIYRCAYEIVDKYKSLTAN
ncbi:MAG: UDP-N-acetylmuramate--L-alanine ligase [Oscillospiraceae bacterium]|nr:UDP-N-acetylmuramate--L-alanine ligase [Oscillospiraceae bacterium]